MSLLKKTRSAYTLPVMYKNLRRSLLLCNRVFISKTPKYKNNDIVERYFANRSIGKFNAQSGSDSIKYDLKDHSSLHLHKIDIEIKIYKEHSDNNYIIIVPTLPNVNASWRLDAIGSGIVFYMKNSDMTSCRVLNKTCQYLNQIKTIKCGFDPSKKTVYLHVSEETEINSTYDSWVPEADDGGFRLGLDSYSANRIFGFDFKMKVDDVLVIDSPIDEGYGCKINDYSGKKNHGSLKDNAPNGFWSHGIF